MKNARNRHEPLADDNLYVCVLRRRSIPYDTQQNQIKRQNNGAHRYLIFLTKRVVPKQTTK